MLGLRQAFTILTLSIYSVLGAHPWNPPTTIPFIVRSPYLHSHLTPKLTTDTWPKHWNAAHINGWDLRILVDGKNVRLFGEDYGSRANRTNVLITPTRSILSMQAGTMNVTITLLSPIEPNDLVLQSFPFAYLYVDAQSNDGQAHSVQIYADVTGEWVSGDLYSKIQWNTVKSSSLIYHHASRTSPLMDEISDMAEDASMYFAFPNGDNVTYTAGRNSRHQWVRDGTLENEELMDYRRINENWPAFAFARDLGTITNTTESVMWAFGLVREPNINYMSQERHPYFWTKYSSIHDAITDFVSDFKGARNRAVAFDDAIQEEARNISEDYVNLVSTAARQAMAGAEITVSKTEGGDWNTSDVMSFMKDIGVSRRANPVHILYAAFPAFLKINSTWAGYLLEPLLRAQNYEDGLPYAIPDLGASYPILNTNMSQTSEKSVAKDASFLKAYYGLFKKWANYLVAQRTELAKFTDQDGLSNSNLALKSILGIKCMAAIADAVGRAEDSATFNTNAVSISEEWKNKVIMDSHIVSQYNDSSSWGLIYNIFYHRLLGFDLIDKNIMTQQDSFYKTIIDAEGGQFGIQYDSSVPDTSNSPWSMLTAAATMDNDVRDKLLSGVHARVVNGSSEVFPTTYSPQDLVQDGSVSSGQASPAQGAAFSLLALNLERKTPKGDGAIQETPIKRPKEEGKKFNHIPAVVGGAVGGLVLVVLLATGYFLYRRRHRQYMNEKATPYPSPSDDSNAGHPFDPSIHQLLLLLSKNHMPGTHPRPITSTSSTRAQAGTESLKSQSQRIPPGTLRSDVENLRRELDQIMEQARFVAPPIYKAAR